MKSSRLSVYLLAGSVALGWPCASAGHGEHAETATTQPNGESQLQLLAWNVGWTPVRPLKGAVDMGRSAAGVGADVIGLVEGFSKEGVRQFASGLGNSYRQYAERRPPASGAKVLNGGLGGFGKQLDVVASDALAWSVCTNLGATFDCPAAKGAMFIRVRLARGQRVNLFVVHLNAGFANFPQVLEVRQKQLRELAGFIARKEPTLYPTIVMGDFNIRGQCRSCVPPTSAEELTEAKEFPANLSIAGTGAPRDAFLEELGHNPDFDGPTIENSIAGKDYRHRYDYVLYYPASGARQGWTLEYQPGSFTVQPFVGSDHRAVSATFMLKKS